MFNIIAVALLIVIAIEDAKTKMIHCIFLYGLILNGLLSVFLAGTEDPLSRVIGGLCLSVPMIIFNLIIKGSFGGGDILICIGAGLLLGWKGMLMAGAIASVMAGFFGAILLISGRAKRDDSIPFGPFLAAGIIFVTVIY